MNDLILDAGVAASVCVAGVRTAEADYLFNKAQLSEVKLWLYTGQISEILDRVQDQLPGTRPIIPRNFRSHETFRTDHLLPILHS